MLNTFPGPIGCCTGKLAPSRRTTSSFVLDLLCTFICISDLFQDLVAEGNASKLLARFAPHVESDGSAVN